MCNDIIYGRKKIFEYYICFCTQPLIQLPTFTSTLHHRCIYPEFNLVKKRKQLKSDFNFVGVTKKCKQNLNAWKRINIIFFLCCLTSFFLPFLEGTCQGRRCKPPKLILPRLDEVNYSSGSVMSFFFLISLNAWEVNY